MPKRTNDFQKLIYLIRKNLAGDADVTESKLLKNRVTKQWREVDVVIHGEVGGQKVLISVECVDHKQKADVSWVETMLGKHRNLATNVLVLASRTGFTKQAIDLARESGVETVNYEEQDTKDFAPIFGPEGKVWFKTSALTVRRCVLTVAASDELAEERVATSPDNLIYSETGEELFQVIEVAQRLIQSPKMSDYMAREAKSEHSWFTCEVDAADLPGVPPIFMKMISPERMRRVGLIHVEGTCKITIAEFGMHNGKVSDVRVAWGISEFDKRKVYAVATEPKNGQRKLSIHFAPEKLDKGVTVCTSQDAESGSDGPGVIAPAAEPQQQ